MKLRWALFLLLAAHAAAEKRIIFPAGAKLAGPYSPGILAGDFLYVSGQGSLGADGKMPATFEERVTQCLENMKAIVEAAGLTMEHVVYTHVYLDDMANYDAMNRVASIVLNAAAAMRVGCCPLVTGASFASTQLVLGLSEGGRRLC